MGAGLGPGRWGAGAVGARGARRRQADAGTGPGARQQAHGHAERARQQVHGRAERARHRPGRACARLGVLNWARLGVLCTLT